MGQYFMGVDKESDQEKDECGSFHQHARTSLGVEQLLWLVALLMGTTHLHGEI